MESGAGLMNGACIIKTQAGWVVVAMIQRKTVMDIALGVIQIRTFYDIKYHEIN